MTEKEDSPLWKREIHTRYLCTSASTKQQAEGIQRHIDLCYDVAHSKLKPETKIGYYLRSIEDLIKLKQEKEVKIITERALTTALQARLEKWVILFESLLEQMQ